MIEVRSGCRIVDLDLPPDEVAGHAEALLDDGAGVLPGEEEAVLKSDRIDRRVGHLEVAIGGKPGLQREDAGGYPIVGAAEGVDDALDIDAAYRRASLGPEHAEAAILRRRHDGLLAVGDGAEVGREGKR